MEGTSWSQGKEFMEKIGSWMGTFPVYSFHSYYFDEDEDEEMGATAARLLDMPSRPLPCAL